MVKKMLSVGDLLRSKRLEKGLKLSEIAAKTKIRESMLSDIEAVNVSAFTSEMHFKSFLKSYAEFLNIDKEKIMALYRRERGIEEEDSDISKSSIKKINNDRQTFIISTLFSTKAILSIVGFLFVGIIIFFFIQFWISLRTPPNLVIISPSSNDVIKTETFVIEGRTDGNNIKVFLDGTEGIYFDKDDPGLFRLEGRFFSPGFRSFIISAENQIGQRTQVSLDLIYSPERTEETDKNNEVPYESSNPTPTLDNRSPKNITLQNNSPILITVSIQIDEEIEPRDVTIQPESTLKLEFNQKVQVNDYDPLNLSTFFLDEQTPLKQINGKAFLLEINGSVPIITNLVQPSL